jgi:hypothetical protein
MPFVERAKKFDRAPEVTAMPREDFSEKLETQRRDLLMVTSSPFPSRGKKSETVPVSALRQAFWRYASCSLKVIDGQSFPALTSPNPCDIFLHRLDFDLGGRHERDYPI